MQQLKSRRSVARPLRAENPSITQRRQQALIPACVETLEARRLLAADIPAGYVKLNNSAPIEVDATTRNPAPPSTPITLENGANYYFVAWGTHRLATSPDREADAQSYQRASDLAWIKGSKPHLRVPGVSSWGPPSADHIYGAAAVGNGAELRPWVNDSYYGDNAGVLWLDVYRQVELNQLTVRDAANPDNAVTADGDPSQAVIYIRETHDHKATIDISGLVTPDTPEAKAMTLWRIDQPNASQAEGDFGSTNNIELTAVDGNKWTVQAGVDENGNGDLDPGEVDHSVDIYLVSITQAIFTDVNNPSYGTITATDMESAPLWVEGWHADGPAVSITTDLNVPEAADQVLVKFTGMTTGNTETLTLAEIGSSPLGLADVGTRVTIGFDDNADGRLDGGEIITLVGREDMGGFSSGTFAAAGIKEVLLGIELLVGDEIDAAGAGGVRPYDLAWLAKYMVGDDTPVQITGDMLTKYRGDADVQIAETNLRNQILAHLDQQALQLTQANNTITIDFAANHQPVNLTDTIFSLGDGYLAASATGSIEATAFDANGRATQYKLSVDIHFFQRDFFRDPTNTGWEPGTEFRMNVDYTEQRRDEVRDVNH